MKHTTCAALSAFALFVTPAMASAELVWRAPLAHGEAALQVESFQGEVAITRPDGYSVSLSERTADRLGATSCSHDGVAYLALGISGVDGSELWIWDAAAGTGRLVTLPAPLASRPAANSDCVLAFATVDGSLGVLDVPARAQPSWISGALAPLDDPLEHPDGLMLAPHGDGWLVGGAGPEARLVVGADVSSVSVDSTLRAGAVHTTDGHTWALSRRGGLYAFDARGEPALISRDRVAPSTGLVRWPGVGLAWGNAIGELVVYDGAELSRVPLSRRALDRALMTSSSSEGSLALVPTADGWIYTVYADLTWTRAPHDAPARGLSLTVEPSGVLLPGRQAALPLVSLTSPASHLDDAAQSELFGDPTRAHTGHVMTSNGLELLDGVPSTSSFDLRARSPSPTPAPQENPTPETTDVDTATPGCAAAGTRPGNQPRLIVLAFGLLWGLRRRRA